MSAAAVALVMKSSKQRRIRNSRHIVCQRRNDSGPCEPKDKGIVGLAPSFPAEYSLTTVTHSYLGPTCRAAWP